MQILSCTGAVLFEDADLRSVNLRGAILIGADLIGANLIGAHLIGAHLSGADIRAANLNGALLIGANLSDADVDDLREQVDLSLVDPDYSANYEVHWEEMGSRDRLLDLSTEYEQTERRLLTGLGVTESLMSGESLFSGDRLKLEVISSSETREAVIEAVRQGADLIGADLNGADLRGANLSAARLREAVLTRADLRRAELREANLSLADLREANLSGANLSEALLRSAPIVKPIESRVVSSRYQRLRGNADS